MTNMLGIKTKSIFGDLLKYLAVAFIVMLPVRLFLIQPFIVSGNSMAPAFTDGNYLVIDELYTQHETLERGDVVIFRYPLDPSLYYIKRIVGMPGETMTIDKGAVSIDKRDGTRQVLVVPRPSITELTQVEPIITKLAKDEYFVLGDNRSESSDSREWGPLQSKFIIGRALMRIWPLNSIEILPGSIASTSVE